MNITNRKKLISSIEGATDYLLDKYEKKDLNRLSSIKGIIKFIYDIGYNEGHGVGYAEGLDDGIEADY